MQSQPHRVVRACRRAESDRVVQLLGVISFGLCTSDPSACCQRGQELGFALASAATLDILRPKYDRNNALSSRLQLARLHGDLPDHPPPDPAFQTEKSATSCTPSNYECSVFLVLYVFSSFPNTSFGTSVLLDIPLSCYECFFSYCTDASFRAVLTRLARLLVLVSYWIFLFLGTSVFSRTVLTFLFVLC